MKHEPRRRRHRRRRAHSAGATQGPAGAAHRGAARQRRDPRRARAGRRSRPTPSTPCSSARCSPPAAGQNPARQAAVGAGIAWNVHSSSVNKVCLSGLTAIIDGARMIAVGDATGRGRRGHGVDDPRAAPADGLARRLDLRLGRGARPHGVRRTHRRLRPREHGRVDRAAQRPVRDHARDAGCRRRTLASAGRRGAAEAGVFDAEIVPVEIPQRKGDPVVVTKDEGIRPDTTVETLAGLRAGVRRGRLDHGRQLVADLGRRIRRRADDPLARRRERLARARGRRRVGPGRRPRQLAARAAGARDREGAARSRGSPPPTSTSSRSTRRSARSSRGRRHELGLSDDVVNPHGGGIAIGHPIGASGNRLVVHAVHELVRRGSGTAAVALCGGGGQGDALILTR